MANPKSIFDQLASFPGGVNSGVDPLLLPKTQLAFALNATLRGDFFRQRPANQTIALSYASALIQTAFQSGYFQGAGYYKPDYGAESIPIAVAGRIFLFTPGDTGAGTVSEITIPGDPNPAPFGQGWFCQAENFLVYNDGLALPYIYDGANARRSVGSVVQTYGSLSAGSPQIPETGHTFDLQVSGYSGPLNRAVDIDGATYIVTAVGGIGGSYAVTMTNLSDAGTNEPAGTDLVVQPTNLGKVSQETYLDASWPDSDATIIMKSPVPPWVVVGSEVRVSPPYPNYIDIWGVTSISSDRKTLGLHLHQGGTTVNGIVTPVAGTSLTLLNYGGGNQTLGTLLSDFTPPTIGSTGTAYLKNQYIGSLNVVVFLGTAQYLITGVSNIPPLSSSVITVENLEDTPGQVIPLGSLITSLVELPAGRVLVYGMGRIWESMIDGISFLAGDIVDGPSGSPAYNRRDSVLKITENDLLAGGGLFRVPGTVGDIKAMQFTAVLDASLGQGPLEVFTPTTVFSCQAPVDRETWKDLVNPILTTALIGSGACSQTSVSPASGDLLFRSSDGLIRSLLMARLDFNQWGNTPISREVTRVLAGEDLSLLAFSTATVFDNRFLMGAQMKRAQRGVYSTSLVALNFDPISSLRGKDPSIYDGQWVGLNVLQLVSGFFNGVQRCFAICLSQDLAQIEIHEILTTDAADYDDGNTPITSYYESPVLFGPAVNQRHNYLRLVYGEISVDSIVGTVQFQAFYKPDQWPNWVPWHSWTQTFTPGTDPGFRPRIGLPEPDATVFDEENNRPLRQGYNFQFKLIGSGKFRFLDGQFESVVIDQPEHLEPI